MRGARGARGAWGARGERETSAQAQAPERGCGLAALKGTRAGGGGPEGRGLEDSPGRWAVPGASAVPGSPLAPSPGILRLGSLLPVPQEQACVSETFTEPLERRAVDHVDEVLPPWNSHFRRGEGHKANKSTE